MSYGIHWFRRDLRLPGNPALEWSRKEHSGKVLGIFCLDPDILSREDFSVSRFQFYLLTLKKLSEDFRSAGGDLLILEKGPQESFEVFFSTLRMQKRKLPATVSWNRDYEPYALQRDTGLERWLEEKQGVRVHTERDHLLIEPHEIRKDDLKSPFYQIYSPYRKKWLARLKSEEVAERIEEQRKGLRLFSVPSRGIGQFTLNATEVMGKSFKKSDLLKRLLEENRKKVSISLPSAGGHSAWLALDEFKKKLEDYPRARDYPGVNGTSRISWYLKNGSFTVAQTIAKLGLEKIPDCKYLHELIWREFYYSILVNFPRVENAAFQKKFNKIPWDNDLEMFEAWKEGRTGFPIVDAAMRELKQTGWMHNRMRMVVASFLVKDLRIDWKWGERHFMKNLLDGDLASNNGGWQWAASTGVDPQPYFRIFNPSSQSKKFDPQGDYIRRWVPELERLDAKRIHVPGDLAVGLRYPRPIVDHKQEARKTLEIFRRASQNGKYAEH